MSTLLFGLLLIPTLLFAQNEQANSSLNGSDLDQLVEASRTLYAAQSMNVGYDFYNNNTRQFRIVVKNATNWLDNLEKTPIHILMIQDAVELSIADKDEDFTKLILQFTNNHDADLLAKEISMIQGVWLVEVSPKKAS